MKKKLNYSCDYSETDSRAKLGKTEKWLLLSWHTSNHDNNVGSREDAQPRTSKKTNAHVQVDSSACDLDTQISSKETKRYGVLKQSASEYGDNMNNLPKVKPSSSGISSTPLEDDQSELVLPNKLVFDDSSSSSKDLSKTLTNKSVNRFSPAANRTTQNVPRPWDQRQQPKTYQAQSSTKTNQTQSSTGASGRIPARKPDVYNGNTIIDERVDSMNVNVKGTNPGAVMYGVIALQIKLFIGPNALWRVKDALKEEFCDWDVLKKCLDTVFDRHSLKNSTIHGHFLFREKNATNRSRNFSMSCGHYATKWP